MTAPVTVFVLVVEHRHGTDFWVFSDEAKARASLFEYVKTWWDDVIDGRVLADDDPRRVMPEDPDAAIEAYFELSFEDFWSINECEVF